MMTLVKGQTNKLWLKVTSSVDISGFSAVLAACSSMKTIDDVTAKDASFEIDSGDLDSAPTKPYMGCLVIVDSEGKEYLKFSPWFKIVSADSIEAQNIGKQTFYLTIASTREAGADSGGGGDLSNYVTKAQLSVAIKGVKDYTDEQIEDIGEVIVQDAEVTVTTPTGETEQVTVADAVQRLVDVEAQVESDSHHHLKGRVEDEDGDGQPDGGVMYLEVEKPLVNKD